MELSTTELEKSLCQKDPSNEFLIYAESLFKERNIQFENYMEIIFLKLFREKEEEKLNNIYNNITKISHTSDAIKVFNNILLSNFVNGKEDDFIINFLKRSEIFFHMCYYISQLPVRDINKVANRLIAKEVVPDFILYYGLLNRLEFNTIDKLTTIFDPLDYFLKRKIILTGFHQNDFSLCNKLNNYFASNPLTLQNVFFNCYDGDELVIAIRNWDSSSLLYQCGIILNYLLSNWMFLPFTFEHLIIKAINSKNTPFIIEAGKLASKTKILELLIQEDAKDLTKLFLEAFSESPEIGHLVVFS